MAYKRLPDETRTITKDGMEVGMYVVNGLDLERERGLALLRDVMMLDPETIADSTLKRIIRGVRIIVLRLELTENLL